ncbi:hypothetical protein [Synechococcus sp. UW140]|uniref:hypothetical protein n=1 Tax=unclassified Synechococcus TaxID=2626047 RepID=UPI0031379481
MEFSAIQNENFKSLRKASSLAFLAFLIFGLLNIAGLAGPSPSYFLKFLCLVLIVSCLAAAMAFKKAGSNFSSIVTTENNDLALLTLANQQLQKALTWASVTVLMILIRSAYFHANFDFVVK